MDVRGPRVAVDAFRRARAIRHDSVGAAIGLDSAVTPSCSERGSREPGPRFPEELPHE